MSWLGSSTDDTGKVKHDRKREQLDQFLYTNPQNKLEKAHNKETMQLVENIRVKRITEEATGKHGFKGVSKAKTRFYELFDAMMEAKNAAASKTNYLINRRKSFRVELSQNCWHIAYPVSEKSF